MDRRTAVYLIWCPDLWPGPCYVGTSYQPRKRFNGHLKAARESKSTGGADCIRAIWEAGHRPHLTTWKWFDTEPEAKEAEARFKELVRGNEHLDPTNRHTGLETSADEEARQRGGRAVKEQFDSDPKFAERMRAAARKGGCALQKRIDSDPNFAAQMSEARRKGGLKGGRKGAAAMLALKDADGKSVNARKGGREGGRISGRKKGALYGRDDLVRYIRKQDPGTGQRAPRSRVLAAEIEREHGIRVQPKTICRIWRGTRYAHVK